MSDPIRPLSPETLDELLSADIDGELDRAASELNLTPQEARAAIAGTPDADTRRRALQAARDLLSTQPTLDPAIASRLVTAALSEAPPAPTPLRSHRRQRVWRTLAGAAAAAAVIAGIVAVSAKNPGSDTKSTSASATTEKAGAPGASRSRAPVPALVLFGDVSQPQALRARVGEELGTLNSPQLPQAVALGPSGSSSHDGLKVPAASGTYNDGAPSTKAEFAANAGALRACISSITRARHLRGEPLLSGTGTYRSRPVYVVVFREAGTTVAYVLAAGNCAVVARDTVL